MKDAALKDIVHITENGNGAFVFCSEEIFDAKIREAAEQAAYEAQEALQGCDLILCAGDCETPAPPRAREAVHAPA